MVSSQVVNIIDKYFNTLETFGSLSSAELNVLLYFMFIDEYYEIRRDIALNNANDDFALTDDVVKKLNNKLELLKEHSDIVKGESLYNLPSMLHWIIPTIN